LFLNNPQYLH